MNKLDQSNSQKIKVKSMCVQNHFEFMTLGFSDMLECAHKRQKVVKGRAMGLKFTITPV